jgi:hypothetical protein
MTVTMQSAVFSKVTPYIPVYFLRFFCKYALLLFSRRKVNRATSRKYTQNTADSSVLKLK